LGNEEMEKRRKSVSVKVIYLKRSASFVTGPSHGERSGKGVGTRLLAVPRVAMQRERVILDL
jgi:hypothetical protein